MDEAQGRMSFICSVTADVLRPHGLYTPPGSSGCGIFQARILEWLPLPPPGDLPNPVTEPAFLVSCALASGFFTINATWEARVL